MNLGLTDHVALVTGGMRGIGAAIAIALAHEGCDVAVVDRDCSGHDAAALGDAFAPTGRRLLRIDADVRDFARATEAIAEVRATLGRLDILVCNAGITRDAISWKMTEAAWDDVIDVNLKGAFAYCHAVASGFRAQGSGRIVCIASINGLRGKVGQANYAAAKGGMVAMARSLARELGRSGVTVNVVAPGMVHTAMADALPQAALQAAIDETVLGRIAEPADVAAAVTFLCSSAARHITGEVIRVDGGQAIGT